MNPAPSSSWTRDWRFKAITAAMAAQIFFSTLLGSWVHPRPFSQETLGKDVPSALRAVGYLSGFKLLVGHIFWLQVIQYYGNSDNASTRYAKLYDYCSLASDLNPNFTSIYSFGAAALCFHLKRPVEAANLLKKGILANPKEMSLKLLYAAIAYQNTQQYDKVIPFLEAQIAGGNAPEMLVNILANTYAEVGRTQDAVSLWQKILKGSDNQTEQIEAAQKLKVLYPLLRKPQKPKPVRKIP